MRARSPGKKVRTHAQEPHQFWGLVASPGRPCAKHGDEVLEPLRDRHRATAMAREAPSTRRRTGVSTVGVARCSASALSKHALLLAARVHMQSSAIASIRDPAPASGSKGMVVVVVRVA